MVTPGDERLAPNATSAMASAPLARRGPGPPRPTRERHRASGSRSVTSTVASLSARSVIDHTVAVAASGAADDDAASARAGGRHGADHLDGVTGPQVAGRVGARLELQADQRLARAERRLVGDQRRDEHGVGRQVGEGRLADQRALRRSQATARTPSPRATSAGRRSASVTTAPLGRPARRTATGDAGVARRPPQTAPMPQTPTSTTPSEQLGDADLAAAGGLESESARSGWWPGLEGAGQQGVVRSWWPCSAGVEEVGDACRDHQDHRGRPPGRAVSAFVRRYAAVV